MRRTLSHALVLLATLAGLARSADAATLTVTDGGDSGPGTFRQAVADASDGDTITFAVADVSLTAHVALDKPLTIEGAGVTITGAGGHRLLRVLAEVTLRDATLANGTVDAPSPLWGGAIYANADLTVERCRFVANDSSANTLFWGGALANDGATLVVRNSTFLNNAVNDGSSRGGAIYSSSGSTLVVESSTFSGNVGGFGGAICSNGATTIVNSTFSTSEAVIGGAILVDSPAVLDLSFSTIYDNSGGVGGGLFTGSATVTARNTIIAGNRATSAGPDIDGTVVSAGHLLIEDTTDTIITGDTETNILGAAPLLGPLAQNGSMGPKTHALYPFSPGFDAGDCLDVDGNSVDLDQRGMPRQAYESCDIGAYEHVGDSQLVDVTDEPAGANCANGGQHIEVGVDVDADGILEAGEVEESFFVCNGSDGADGNDGSDGSDGSNGSDGADGADGDDGADGAPGLDGADGSGCQVGGSSRFGLWLLLAALLICRAGSRARRRRL